MPIEHQIFNLIKFASSFVFLFMIYPFAVFREKGDFVERFFSGFIKMVFVFIVFGYVFVVINLYEFLSLFIMLVFFAVFWNRRVINHGREKGDTSLKISLILYDIADGIFVPRKWLKNKYKYYFQCAKSQVRYSKDKIYVVILLFVVLGTAYLRFKDPLAHAAPGLSDASVTLAWMKYIKGRILFHDGIYPQGFHIYLATLQEFARSDAIYILKYAGPLNGVLTTIGIYFLVFKFSSNKMAGILAAFSYGILGPFLPLGWTRQASTNSQEFAMVFLAPVWYFTARYLETKEKRLLVTGFAGFAVIGFIHTLVWGFMVIGVAIMIFISVLSNFRTNIKSCLQIILAGVITSVLTMLPLLFGFVAGTELHSSSLQYLTTSMLAEITKLSYLDYAAVIGTIIYLLYLTIEKIKGKILGSKPFIVLLCFVSLFAYAYLGWLTQNALLAGRTGILWSVVVSISIGMGWDAL
ncbi:MAG: hypothetical protein WCR27_07285, partial [Eubacteriales bacterium]